MQSAKTDKTQGVTPANDSDVDFQSVPPADAEAVLDPQFSAMRSGTNLPQTDLPPAMAGHRPPWIRGVALVLVAMFLAATAAGVCLTYGPPSFGF